MLWQQLQEQTVELGWSFYGPVIAFVLLCGLAVPVWAAIGVAACLMLYISGVLPLSLVGEALFDGIDAFALTANNVTYAAFGGPPMNYWHFFPADDPAYGRVPVWG